MAHHDTPHNPLPVQRLTSNGQLPDSNPNLRLPGTSLVPFTAGEAKSAGPTALTSSPSPGALWCAFCRRWLLAVAVGLTGAVLAVAGVFMVLPARYTAVSMIMVNPPNAIGELGESSPDL